MMRLSFSMFRPSNLTRFFVILLLISAFVSFLEARTAVAVLLDVSRSTPAGEFEIAKKTIKDLQASLPQGDELFLFKFGDSVHQIELQELDQVQLTENQTRFFDATYDVSKFLAKNRDDSHLLLVFSDGEDNHSSTILEDTVTLANSRNITVESIGMGRANVKVLERLAKLTNGQYFTLTDPNLLDSIRTAIPKGTSAAPSSVKNTVSARKQPKAQPAAAPQKFQMRDTINYILWSVLAIAALFLTFCLVRIFMRKSREQKICPSCGTAISEDQIVCAECGRAQTGQTRRITDAELDRLHQDFGPAPQETTITKLPSLDTNLAKTVTIQQIPLLIVQKGKIPGQSFPLGEGHLSIGRSDISEIMLDDLTISGQHCRIIAENGHHVLHDLGSTNGTFVNETKINKVVLRDGDMIRIGQTVLLYKFSPATS
jgi:FHA domain/von Willebrand factor type A domain